MPAPDSIHKLVKRFEEHRDSYLSGRYNETQLRSEFLDPFFEALGWDIFNKQGFAEAYKDVLREDSQKVEGSTRSPDYTFRVGGMRKFFVEAKKPAVNIQYDIHPAFQLRRYAWSAKLPLGILTDFEEFAIYESCSKPDYTDSAATGRVNLYRYTDYLTKWEEIAAVFSRESVMKGAFDQYTEGIKGKRGTLEVDDAFLAEIESWRDLLARTLALRNTNLSVRELNYAVQMTIDRIVFLRICEDREIEPEYQLKELLTGEKIYERLCALFQAADRRYNSGLFHFNSEKGQSSSPDNLTLGLVIDDKSLKEIIRDLYYPSPYVFKEIPTDILGQVYERFLGKVIRLTAGHQAKVEEKPEVRKAGGVYYTPTYIVDYIVKNTVGKLLEDKTPREASKLKIVDPACGSGSFLLGAYQYLLDWYLKWYSEHDPLTLSKGNAPVIYQGEHGEWRLTTAEKKRILLDNIHGVDIDPQAVEVTKLSLSLKVLEGESKESIGAQLSLFKERALPDLGRNIQCGNSLIGPDYYEGRQLSLGLEDDEERQRVNAFDWKTAFPEVFNVGGFDAVIGNPPYGTLIPIEQQEYFNRHFQYQDYQKDWYLLFLEQYYSILQKNGFLGVIVSNTWLQSVTLRNIRYYLSNYYYWEKLLHLPDKVFAAVVDTLVLIFRKSIDKSMKENKIVIDFREKGNIYEHHLLDSNFIPKNGDPINIVAMPQNQILYKKILSKSSSLKNNYDVFNGVKPFEIGKGNPPQKQADVDGRIYVVEGKKPDITWSPLLRGSLITKYCNNWIDNYWIKYGEWLAAPRNPRIFSAPFKIVVRQTGDSIIATLIESGFICRNNLHIILPKNPNYKLEYLLGIMNSRLMDFAYTFMNPEKGEALAEIKKEHVEKLPIRIIDFSLTPDKEKHDKIVSLVESMLELKKRLPRTPQEKERGKREIEATDAEIDQLVYELYGLTDEEIRIVEGRK